MLNNLNIVVLAKQVPDTRNVGKNAMKEDGTVNRGALDAVFNPEDLNALEQALRIKENTEGTTVTILTMGPVRSADIIREAMYRGADDGILLTDKLFAGSDTLATSYALSQALKKINPDLIVCGRQAIDGDTAQVGPQVAEKLNMPQITYAEDISIKDEKLIVKRRLENGVETVTAKLPLVITVNSSAPKCRFMNAMRLMTYKSARTVSELQNENTDYTSHYKSFHKIKEWNVNDVEANAELLGLSGSPTKVKKIDNVVFKAKESLNFSSNDKDIDKLVELINSNN